MTQAQRGAPGAPFWAVALLLFSAGWAANHFASMLPVLRVEGPLSAVAVNSAFGVYAVGLLPGLLGGGGLADRFGPRPVVLTGSLTAAVGNVVMIFGFTEPFILTGRLIVGVGVGLAVSAGTAWAAGLRGTPGAALAGLILTCGFAAGPVITGAFAAVLPGAGRLTVPYATTAALSLLAVAAALRAGKGATAPSPGSGPGAGPGEKPRSAPGPQRGGFRALAAALPMALWVFSCATVAFVVLPARLPASEELRMLLPGAAAALAFSTGLGVQVMARRQCWGPFAGVAGALLAAAGFVLVAVGGQAPSVWLFLGGILLLGAAYGLCLREGLVDVDRLVPPASRGLVIGVYYTFTYLGFGLPVLLEALGPAWGPSLPLVVLAGAAVVVAVLRALHIRCTDHLIR
ncbi:MULTISPECIES: MFS transporter [Actinomycetes]|uniref:MFS transporter n=2 Tax=Actinomycetes TaxID=1760 RepID=A0ABP6LS23_9MICC